MIEYDGTDFAGSQYQPRVRTVQGELEEALNRLTGERTRVRFAGRTDAGVHATGQVAAFCLARRPRGEGIGWPELRRRLNATLPPDLALRSLRPASAGFDPRRDARSRVYRYRIRMAGDKRPVDRHRTLEIGDRLDVAAMRAVAAELLGERDFAALGSNAEGRTIRHLREVSVVQRGTSVEIRVTANAFLRRMVRSIVALLLEAGRGRLAPGSVAGLLDAGERVLHGRAAPARGLTLERVIYSNTTSSGNRIEEEGNVTTYAVKASEIERSWFVVDATDQTLGRLATRIATLLEGKHKPIYSPHLDTGDHVVVINAAKHQGDRQQAAPEVVLPPFRLSRRPEARRACEALMARKPEIVIERAVKGMLPQNRLGRAMFKKLHVYRGPEHRHQAQQPTAAEL